MKALQTVVVLLIVGTAHLVSCKPNFPAFQACLTQARIPEHLIISNQDYGNNTIYSSLNVQWQLKPPHSSPLAFVLVRNERDVGSIVRCGLKSRIKVVANGGGHSFEKFSFGDDFKVVVDLRNLNGFFVDKSKQKLSVGAAWLSAPLQWRLWDEAKSLLPTTFCPTVGISGSSLGGGHGPFAGQYGMALDNILEMNIVTADGRLRRVNADKHSDLFWALRGAGGGSFGIVTKFVFKIYPAPDNVFYARTSFSAENYEAFFQAWQKFTITSPHSISSMAYLNADGSSSIDFFDVSGTDTAFQEIIKDFPLSAAQINATYSFPDFLLFQAKVISAEFLQPGFQLEEPKDLANLRRESKLPIYQIRKSYFVSQEVGLDSIRAFLELISRKPDPVLLWFEQYGGALNDILPNATAFVHRGETMYNINASFKTVHAPKELSVADKAWLAEFLELGEDRFGGYFTYQNYVDIELKDYLRKYFGSNLERLVEVKKKYDPSNYFENPQSIPVQL